MQNCIHNWKGPFSNYDTKSDEIKHKRGTGFWKFNQSLLQDENYVSSPLQIPNFKQKYVDVEELRLKWDLIKIRGFTTNIPKIKQRKEHLQKSIFKIKSTSFTKKLKHYPIKSKLSMKSKALCSIRLRVRFLEESQMAWAWGTKYQILLWPRKKKPWKWNN